MPSFANASRVRRSALRLGAVVAIATAAGLSLGSPNSDELHVGDAPSAPASSDNSGLSSGKLTVFQDLARASTAIVLARVEGTEATWTGPHGLPGIHTAVRLSSEDVIKGDRSQTAAFWVQGGIIGDRARRVVGQAHFSAGEQVLVFLTRSADGAYWPTRMGLGKWLVEPCGQTTCVRHAEAKLGPLPVVEVLASIAEAGGTP